MIFVAGKILLGHEFVEGYVGIEEGRILEMGDGACPQKASASGVVIPSFINGHTHCADGRAPIGIDAGLLDAVAPPDGIKHVYLRQASEGELRTSMSRFMDLLLFHGSSAFIDFREGGLRGVELLRDIPSPADRIILGRPESQCYDEEEVDAILDVADGLGISGVGDMDGAYLDSLADHVRRRGKMLAMHLSENRREDLDKALSLDPDFLVHMTEATDGDMRRCADADVPVVVCPSSNLFFGKVTPLRRMSEAGLDMMLGTDNHMICSPDMRSEGELFIRLMRSQGGDPYHVLDSAILNVRKILYAESELPISLGKTADLTVFPGDGRCPLTDLFLRPDGPPTRIHGDTMYKGGLLCHSTKY